MKKLFALLILSTFLAYNLDSQDLITVSIDFGHPSSELPWNNMQSSQSGFIANLLNQQGQGTDISIKVTDSFNGTNETGTQDPDASLNMPATATGDSFFGNAVEFSDKIEPTGGVTLSGLDPDQVYTLEIFASRVANDNRETEYLIEGSTSEIHYLNVSSNTDESIILPNLSPNDVGEIILTATTGPNNDNTYGFFYLGALRISYEGELISLDSLLVLQDPLGGEYWQSGETPKIKWSSQSITDVQLEYSVDAGNNWLPIGNTSAFAQEYTWTVPNLSSSECLVRISAGSLQDQSLNHFTITETDTASCQIVVLGSSTAAGVGPTSRDSAWVWLYEDYIYQNDTRFHVTNLARGGFTTYNILPNDTELPPNISFTIDTTRNITKALTLKPDALIINLPSNDAASLIPVSDQISNYNTILEEIKTLEIPYWICTPQPRNGLNTGQQDILNEMVDSTLSVFNQNYIDFWTDLATNSDKINDAYNSGDGVHLNNAGHKLLLQRVLSIGIDSLLLDTKSTSSFTQTPPVSKLNCFPNPTTDYIILQNISGPSNYLVIAPSGKIVQNGKTIDNKVYIKEKGLHYVLIKTSGKTYLTTVIKK